MQTPKADLAGTSIFTLLHQDDLPRAFETMARLVGQNTSPLSASPLPSQTLQRDNTTATINSSSSRNSSSTPNNNNSNNNDSNTVVSGFVSTNRNIAPEMVRLRLRDRPLALQIALIHDGVTGTALSISATLVQVSSSLVPIR